MLPENVPDITPDPRCWKALTLLCGAFLFPTRRGDSVQIEGVSNPADLGGYAEWARR